MIEALAFYLFAAVALGSAIAIVLTGNIVRAAVALLGTLGAVAALYFVLNAHLLAVIQLIVYAGGTLILIVFGVMLTSSSPWAVFAPTRRQRIAAGLVAAVLALGLIMLLTTAQWSPSAGEMAVSASVEDAGRLLLQDYLVPFEVASVLLLVVMIGAAYLARTEK